MSVRHVSGVDATLPQPSRLALVLGAGMTVEPTGVKREVAGKEVVDSAARQRQRDRARLARRAGVTKYPHAPAGHYDEVEPPPPPAKEATWLAEMDGWSTARMQSFAEEIMRKVALRQHDRRMTVTPMDEVYRLRRQGRTIHGFGA